MEISKKLDEIQKTFEDGLDAMRDRVDDLEGTIVTDNRRAGLEGRIPSAANDNEERAQLTSFLRTGNIPNERRDMSAGTNSEGGYAVETDVSREIRDQLLDISPMRKVCRIETSQTGDYRVNVGVRGIVSGWVGETALRPVTAAPALTQVAPPIGEIYANTKVTQHLLDDANFGVASWKSVV